MADVFRALASALFHATTFEQAATSLGNVMLDVTTEALEESDYANGARILRVMVHVRPDDGYRKLTVIEQDVDGDGQDREPCVSYVPSATAWRWVASHRSAVSIDGVIGRVQPHAPKVAAHVQKRAMQLDPMASKETLDRFVGRRVTHVCALPIRMPGGAIHGMVAIEADARIAMGKDLIWMLVGEDLQVLVDLAAPHLVSLPQAVVAKTPIDDFLPVVGKATAPLVSMLRVFAKQEETILLSGPTGAGKSRLARWCKEQSARKGGPFEVLDLMTVPEDLQMAELFGWKRGAFTGAVKDSLGTVGRAENGTLFIDEIDKLSLKAQAGLLHLLEERTYRVLGEGDGEKRANVRFIIGTNANLLQDVQAGKFREDLYYRINVLPLKIPPLDERSDEIPAWADYMLKRRHRESSAEAHAILSEAAGRMLASRGWPGNLRQLDNVVRRAYALALMKHGDATREIVLTDVEVEMALAYEDPRSRTSVTEAMREAARRFVVEAELRRDAKTLNLDHTDAFKGLVLAAAEERLGSKDEAYRLLGKEALLANRNHHKPFRKEIEKLHALYEALGEAERFPYKHLLES
ncbi:MAG: sigma-54-dependent Fis family transcriptional regulator [Polyangiaceae bacterium]|nr:sigma-54-dependent Fis family transcriptional regulator [Polyangiaceae bacterium]